MEQDVKNELYTDDVIQMVNENAKRKSLEKRRTEVKGESYRSPEETKQKIIEEACTVIVSVAIFVFVGVAGHFIYISDKEGDIRREVNDTYVTQNIMGGQYETVKEHDENFINYAKGLKTQELIKIYDETEKRMAEESEGPFSVDAVVDKMEDNYLEEKGKGM